MLGERLPERLSPLASGMGLRPFYGDLHNHCDISYGHGSLEQALRRARRQLDFVSVTGHAYWPDMPVETIESLLILSISTSRALPGWKAAGQCISRRSQPPMSLGVSRYFPAMKFIPVHMATTQSSIAISTADPS